MLQKEQLSEKNVTQVTFMLPADVQGEVICVVGDFNDWQTSHTMERQEDGSWQLTAVLEPEHEYEFRYLVDGHMWLNDPEADKYVLNPHGSHNCVVIT